MSLPPSARLARMQGGQALVFATFTSILVIVALFAMYSMGGQTIEKIKLQNAADAAVYSATLAEARDYNFSAYTNRAMIANQVGVAQFVGLTSWFRNLSAFANNNDPANAGRSVLYELMMNIWPGGTLKGAYKTVYSLIGKAAGVFDEGKLGSTFMKGAITLLDGLIRVYSESQRIYHYATALTVVQTLGAFSALGGQLDTLLGTGDLFEGGFAILDGSGDVLKANDANIRLTGSSAFYLAYHFYKWFNFTEFKDPNSNTGGDGAEAERFAQVTTDSLDDFSRDRSTKPAWGFSFFYAPPLTYVDPTVFIPYTSGPLFMPVIHRGGTELKVTNAAGSGSSGGTGGGDGSSGTNCDGSSNAGASAITAPYWSGLPATACDAANGTVQTGDSTHPAGGYTFVNGQWVDARCFGTTPPAGCPTITHTPTPASAATSSANSGGASSKVKRSWTAMDASSFSGLDIFWITWPLPPIPIPIPIPFAPPWVPVAHGAAQSGKQLDKANSLSGDNNFGRTSAESYGESLSSWTSKVSAAMQQEKGAGTSLTLSPNTFGGLTKYMDVKNIAATDTNLEGPSLVIEIEKDVSDMAKAPGTGQFELVNGAPVRTADSKAKMRSLSKAQVYFARPTNDTALTWFKRKIGTATATELGSLYNPYWQAHLRPNNFIEQYLSMEIQRAGVL